MDKREYDDDVKFLTPPRCRGTDMWEDLRKAGERLRLLDLLLLTVTNDTCIPTVKLLLPRYALANTTKTVVDGRLCIMQKMQANYKRI